MKATVEQKQKFLSVFKIQVHSMASQTLCFDAENDRFLYEKTRVIGGTDLVILDVLNGERIIEAEGADEETLVNKWAIMFAECDEDIEAFIDMAENDEDGEDY